MQNVYEKYQNKLKQTNYVGIDVWSLLQEGGAIAQSVEQSSRNPVTWVRNQGINPHYQVPRRGPKAVGRLVAYLQAFVLS